MFHKGTSYQIERILTEDLNGTKMRQIKLQLEQKRSREASSCNATIETLRAYDAAISLLPDLWRLKQRRD